MYRKLQNNNKGNYLSNKKQSIKITLAIQTVTGALQKLLCRLFHYDSTRNLNKMFW